MKRFISALKRAPKRIALAASVLVALIALPLHSIAATDVLMEGSMGVANQTKGETTYKESTNAAYDEVVKFQVYYHNRELADSARVANNFKIKIDMPQTAGTNQVVKVTMSGDGTNVITDTATVVLDRADAQLEYIPGSAYWKHNKGTRTNINLVTEQIADNIILQGQKLEDVQPCFEYEATVTFMARVRIPSVGITKTVRKAGNNVPTVTSLAAQPGDRLQYVVTAKNMGNQTLSNVYLRDPLPQGLTFVPGTAKKYYGEFNGTVMTADEATAFFTGKKNIGSLGAGAQAFITFEATLPAVASLECGTNTIKNIAVVDTDQTGEYNNFATVTLNKECVSVQSADCTGLSVVDLGGRKRRFDVTTAVANGATVKQYSYDFGDGSTIVLTDKASQEHTYTNDGTYTARVKVTFMVNGTEKVVANDLCAKPVTVTTTTTTPPVVTSIPNTGAGSIVGLFAAVTIAGSVMHRLVLARRFNA